MCPHLSLMLQNTDKHDCLSSVQQLMYLNRLKFNGSAFHVQVAIVLVVLAFNNEQVYILRVAAKHG